MNNHKYLIALIVLSSQTLMAEDLTEIQISVPSEANAIIKNEAIEAISTKNSVDGGDLLRSVNGVNTIRRGGHGLDPVIRGQSDQRLNSLFMELAQLKWI